MSGREMVDVHALASRVEALCESGEKPTILELAVILYDVAIGLAERLPGDMATVADDPEAGELAILTCLAESIRGECWLEAADEPEAGL